MRFKKIILIIGVVLLASNNIVYAEAATDTGIVQPYYTTISSAEADISNNSGVLTLDTKLVAKQKSNLSITMKLQKKSGTSWTTIKTWNASKSSAYSLSINETYTVSRGTYRIASTLSTGTETTTVYSATITY